MFLIHVCEIRTRTLVTRIKKTLTLVTLQSLKTPDFDYKPPIMSIDSNPQRRTTQALFKARQGFLEFPRMVAEEGLEPPTRGL